jgi:HEAT repeat protein
MEGRRRPTSYIAIAVIAVILIGWLTIRYMGKRQLIDALDHRNLQVRVAAAQKLLDMEALSDALPAQPIIVRSKTAEALGEIGTDPALKVLGEILKDQEEAPRRWARQALVKLGMKSMPVLLSALSASGGTRDEAVTALKQIGSQTAEEVRFLLPDRGAYSGAATALAQLGPEGVKPLLLACYNEDGDLRAAALNNLGLRKVEAAVEPALHNLGSDPNNKKGAAIKALGFIGDRRAVPALIPFLKDKSNREGAVTSLGLLRDPRAVEPILSTLLATEKRYRNAAILALGRIGAPALAALVRELGSPQVLMREAAAEALIGSNTPTVNGPLMAALKDSDAQVRASAARALGWGGNVAAVPSLVAALPDKSWPVVDSSVGALGAIGIPAEGALLAVLQKPGEDLTVSYQIARALAAMGRPAVPKLIAALSDRSPSVQKWSAVALGAIGDPQAVEALQKLGSTAGPDVRWVVQEQLRRLTGMSG